MTTRDLPQGLCGPLRRPDSAYTRRGAAETCSNRPGRYLLSGRGLAQPVVETDLTPLRVFFGDERPFSQHRAEVLYQALNNVQLAFTEFLGRPLNFGKTTPPEDILQRYQFDVIYKF